MADDRMRNDDLDRNMGGGAGQKKGDFGQQTPGRNKQDDDLRTGQRGTGQGQKPQEGGGQEHFGDDFGTSGSSNVGKGGQGGRNQ